MFKRLIGFSLLAVLLFGCSVRRDVNGNAVTMADEHSILHNVTYGYRNDQLVFVVFQSGKKLLPTTDSVGFVFSPTKGNLCKGFINLPDGRSIEVSEANKGFQIIAGKVIEFDLDMPKSELEAYLKSGPKEFNLEGFRKYLRTPKHLRAAVKQDS